MMQRNTKSLQKIHSRLLAMATLSDFLGGRKIILQSKDKTQSRINKNHQRNIVTTDITIHLRQTDILIGQPINTILIEEAVIRSHHQEYDPLVIRKVKQINQMLGSKIVDCCNKNKIKDQSWRHKIPKARWKMLN